MRFSILPVPLQNRPWFWPLVVMVGLWLAWLAWLSIANVRRLAGAIFVLREEIAIRRRTEWNEQGPRRT